MTWHDLTAEERMLTEGRHAIANLSEPILSCPRFSVWLEVLGDRSDLADDPVVNAANRAAAAAAVEAHYREVSRGDRG